MVQRRVTIEPCHEGKDRQALRALAFVKDARIELAPQGGGRARAHVWVRDAWTLAVDAGFEQVGGQRNLHFGVQDQNFLGSGKTVGFSVVRNHERTERQYSYRDPQLLGSRWRLQGDFQDFTDGRARGLAVDRPFFALPTPWSCSFQGETRKSSLHRRAHGAPAGAFRVAGRHRKFLQVLKGAGRPGLLWENTKPNFNPRCVTKRTA